MEMSPCSLLTFRKKEVLSGTTQQQCAVPVGDSKSGVKETSVSDKQAFVCTPSELWLLFHFIWGIIRKEGKVLQCVLTPQDNYVPLEGSQTTRQWDDP